jgi:3-dehydroshikimate dehydratase
LPRPTRSRGAALLLLALPAQVSVLVPVHALAQTDAPAPAIEVLRVTRYADDADEGSLRWAIDASNGAPGRYRIEIAAVGAAPYVIKPAALLPPIKGPAQIAGAAWAKTGEFIVLDGAGVVEDKGPGSCPGAVPGQFGANVRTTTSPGLAVVDTAGIDISGLEIRNFCIGVLIHRSSNTTIHDNRIVANRGGAGVMLTGDDGSGNSTATTVHNKVLRNVFLDNGDGLELTRGAAFNLVAENVFRSTAANKEPSQGIEILLGHDNVVVRNRFEGYSDGVQVNSGNRNFIGANTFTDNTLGLSLSGVGNMIDGNIVFGNAVGVAVRPTAGGTVARISRNSIFDNGRRVERCAAGGSCDPELRRGGIVLGTPGPEHARYVGLRGGGVTVEPDTLAKICPDGAPAADCQAAPNKGLKAPRLDTVRQTGAGLNLQGHFDAAPLSRFTVEVFANRLVGGAEGEFYLGDAVTATDANGHGVFSLTVGPPAATPQSFTATLTSGDGATSEFSDPVALSR